jgi:uroporphyrinogen-III decarboxylase
MAAAMDPKRFDEKFFRVVFPKSLAMITTLAEVDSPFVFCHDDLVDAKGPMFHPGWYENYIFPRYEQLWRPGKERGRQVVFVADGNMNEFLRPLRRTGVDGVMLENPATDFDRILDVFGDKIVIGGIETGVLMHGSPEQVRRHVLEVNERTRGVRGFVMASPGGIHGNLPLENLVAYFDARVETGHTPEGWKKQEPEGGAF